MSDLDDIARRPVLAGIGATAFAAFFNPALVRAQALTIADVYVPFTDIGGAVLEKIAAAKGVKITADDREELTGRFATMPSYPDVPGAL
jgi:2-haloacid dehalogenase